jgi:hypothetical protein
MVPYKHKLLAVIRIWPHTFNGEHQGGSVGSRPLVKQGDQQSLQESLQPNHLACTRGCCEDVLQRHMQISWRSRECHAHVFRVCLM